MKKFIFTMHRSKLSKRSRLYFERKNDLKFFKTYWHYDKIDQVRENYQKSMADLIMGGSPTKIEPNETDKPWFGKGATVFVGPDQHHAGIEILKAIIDSQEKHLYDLVGISVRRQGTTKLETPWDSQEDVKRRMDFMFSGTGIAYPGPIDPNNPKDNSPVGGGLPTDFIGMRYIKDAISPTKKNNDEESRT